MNQNNSAMDPRTATVDESEASRITGFALPTLRKRRWEGKPPVFLKVGRKVRYRMSDLLAFLDACTVTPRG